VELSHFFTISLIYFCAPDTPKVAAFVLIHLNGKAEGGGGGIGGSCKKLIF
jgi:hypothetical protein